MYTSIAPTRPKEKSYSDQTGRFPHRSTRGSEYIFTMYDYDSNAIIQQPLKNRQGATIAKAFTMCYKTLTQHGRQVKNCYRQ